MTQQYTKGLGRDDLETARDALGEFVPVEKTVVQRDAESLLFMSKTLKKTGPKNDHPCMGIEAHVCVMQTAIGPYWKQDIPCFLRSDCVSSRSNLDLKYAIRRMAQSGVVQTTYEAILFELCGGAKEPGFKEISALVK